MSRIALLDQALQDARVLAREAFLVRYPHASFLVRPHASLSDTTLAQTLSPDDQGSRQGYRLIPIVKHASTSGLRTLFTLGRASGNDLRFNSAGVSKFHCYVRTDMDPQQLVDGGSTYGTTLNGERLIPKQGEALTEGDNVILGHSVSMAYLSPNLLYEQLIALLSERDTPTQPLSVK